MELQPTLYKFEPTQVQDRAQEIVQQQTKRAQLEQELYELSLKEYEIKQQLGKKTEKPYAPFIPLDDKDPGIVKRKEETFATIQKILAFGESGSVEVKEYEQDDGIGTDVKTKYVYEVQEGMFCVASVCKHRAFGWTKDTTTIRHQTAIYSPDLDFPLHSEASAPTTLDTFKPGSWRSTESPNKLLDVLRWQKAIDSATTIIDAKGELHDFIKVSGWRTTAKRVKVEDTDDEWLIQKGGRWESYDEENALIYVCYTNKLLGKGFRIELQPNNMYPGYINDDSGSINHRNYMDYVEKVIEHVEAAQI